MNTISFKENGNNGGRVMSDYGKMDYPTAYGTVCGDNYSGYGTPTAMNPPKEGKSLLGKPVEGVTVQRIEVSLTDETIDKLSEAFAESMSKMQLEMTNIDDTIKMGVRILRETIFQASRR